VNERPKQLNLPGVPRAKQGREVPPHWAWTEAEVWTERMLATLERGIAGGKWYSLMDKVTKEGTLRRAAQAVIRNQGVCKDNCVNGFFWFVFWLSWFAAPRERN